MRKSICVAFAFIASVAMVGCGAEPRLPIGGTGATGGDAGQGGTGAAGSGGEAGTGGTGGGVAGSGGSDDPGCVPEERTDEFRNPARPKVDVLWVIDNSKAMAPFVDRLAGHLEGARAALDEQAIDYHLALTTTGLDESPDCDGSVRGGEDGRLVPVDGSASRILDRTMPDVAALWREKVAGGACHDSSHPMEAAWRALSAPLADHEKDPRHDTEWMDGNAGFLRENASLSIVVVTPNGNLPGADRSPVEYLDLFQSIKGPRPTLWFSAITGPKGTDRSDECPAEDGDRLLAIAQPTGGLTLDICSLSSDGKEWSQLRLEPFDWFPAGYYLSSSPSDRNGDGIVDEGDLVVTVDGVEIPARTSDGRRVWRYGANSNDGIFFSPLSLPKLESVIRVTYLTCPPG